MDNYHEKYMYYKRKYIELKKEIAQRKQLVGGNKPTYLQYGPTDSYVIDSDQEFGSVPATRQPLRRPTNVDNKSEDFETTEQILGFSLD